MYLKEAIPILQHKIVYFVGASNLELETESEVADLAISLNEFLLQIENEKANIVNLSENELEVFYNNIYKAMLDFTKIQKKLQHYHYFGNTSISDSFNQTIKALKQMRKDLLKIIEGDLVNDMKLLKQQTILS